MLRALLQDFLDNFINGLNLFIFLTIFTFETHQILLFKKVLKMVGLELSFILYDLEA